jgi:SagB-type dehydrogenase family enzyme
MDATETAEAGSITPLAYHRRTRHLLERYALGPAMLDWDAQPDPFRRYAPCQVLPLPLQAAQWPVTWDALHQGLPAQPMTLAAVGLVLECSLGLAAWKSHGSQRWALRCHPSSGNLHPTEGYVVARGIAELPDGVHHYRPDIHGLEQRCVFAHQDIPGQAPRLLIGLSTIFWREAWKYGERAFRYCALDMGHVLASVSYAAALVGWQLQPLWSWGDAQVATLLGLDQPWGNAEPEWPELVLEVRANQAMDAASLPEDWLSLVRAGSWHGQANRLDPDPCYRWPVIEAVARATARPAGLQPIALASSTGQGAARLAVPGGTVRAAGLILQRRSAQRFDPVGMMTLEALRDLLGLLAPQPAIPPWSMWNLPARVHVVLFVHRVTGLAPGLYALPRSPAGHVLMQQAMDERFVWQPCAGLSQDGWTSYLLQQGDAREVAGLICCHQAIAAQGCVALAMLAELEPWVAEAPWRYRLLHWEAGILGQVLYLGAEGLGLRGTGIGCFFDEALAELLGLADQRLHSLYHFTIGHPLADQRIATHPPYAHLQRG